MAQDTTKAQKVQVSLLGREFAVACTPSEKTALQHAARMLDERLKALRSQGSGAACNFDQLLVVVALNLCNELDQKSSYVPASGSGINVSDIETIIHKIDSALT